MCLLLPDQFKSLVKATNEIDTVLFWLLWKPKLRLDINNNEAARKYYATFYTMTINVERYWLLGNTSRAIEI